ncbi:protein Wiz, partial [Notothenia coriiceps]|uniref:Protein Wiz n=1 Tax=Notothenia coriiceps TaxID=8208 RepID=A0A6I9PJV3_9TELE
MEEEADNSEAEKRPKGKETKEPERDVYTFPGDSDPESPPPAPWAQCTFIQQCRKKRVLLRPFSGLGTLKRTLPETDSPGESNTTELSQAGGVLDFEEAAKEERKEEKGCKDIFTCVECSIYFKKQVHLQEHIVEHCESGAGVGRRLGKGGRFQCTECGWNLANRIALSDHHRRHQESRLKILGEIEKLNENGKAREILEGKTVKRVSSAVMQDASPASVPGKMSDPEIVAPLSPVSTPQADSATPTVPRAQARRRFICSTCNFSTRTPQALANHAKTHTRKKAAALLAGSPPSSLACGHCAFLTSSQTVMREHQKLVHPGQASVCGPQADKTRTSKPSLDSDLLSGSGLLNVSRGESQEVVSASEDSMMPNSSPSRMVLKRVGNRYSKRGKSWTNLAKFLGDDKLIGSEEEQDEDQSTELDDESYQQDAKSLIGGKRHTRAQSNTEDCSAQNASLSLPLKKCVKEEDELEVEKDGKLLFLRRSHRVPAAPAEIDSDDDDDEDIDEESVRRFLSEGFLDVDSDEMDEDSEALRSVERKCPYCPDRFHNGIGLANHVRGHLNRVGVSYNVRHFISPEEVNAIEKKFSYQKKKKKVANFDPSTFSVMHCEFCRAGFDTRAGLSSHARAHLRDFGITNWDVTISPIHILRELFLSRPDLVIPTDPPRSSGSSQEEEEEEEEEEEGDEGDEEEERELGEGIVMVKLEEETESERTLRDSLPSGSPKRCKKEDGEEESEAMSHEVEPTRDIRCEFCGEYFENRKGLSSHARSHLRQMGITEWSVNGSPIDTLREVMHKQGGGTSSRSDQGVKKESTPGASSPLWDNIGSSEGLGVSGYQLSKYRKSPLSLLQSGGSRLHKQGLGSASATPPAGKFFRVSPLGKRPLSEEGQSVETTHSLKTFSPLTHDFSYKRKPSPDKHGHQDPSCELCGFYFENRKALASHARAHLRQFGVTEWCVNGSPIETLSAWIRSRPQKVLEMHRSYMQGTRTTLKKRRDEEEEEEEERLSREADRGPSSRCMAPALCLNSSVSMSRCSRSMGEPLDSEYSTPKCRRKQNSLRLSGASFSCGAQMGLLERLEVKPFIPPALRSGERKGEDTGSREEMGAFLTTEEGDPERRGTGEETGEEEEEQGRTAFATLARRERGRGFSSKSMSPNASSSRGSEGEGFLAERGSRREEICFWPSTCRCLEIWRRMSTDAPQLSEALRPSRRRREASRVQAALPCFPGAQTLRSGKLELLLILSCFLILTYNTTNCLSGVVVGWMTLTPAQGCMEKPLTGRHRIEEGQKPPPGTVKLRVAIRRGMEVNGWEKRRKTTTPPIPHKEPIWGVKVSQRHNDGLCGEPLKEIGCEFCGEYFENRKGLSSHARSHLRQMGITEWSVNGSPIDTLREVITRRGLPCALPLKPLKTPPHSSPGPPRSPLPTSSSSPSSSLLSRLPFAFARPASPLQSKSSSTPPTSSSSGLILNLKPEPVQMEVTAPGSVGRTSGFSGDALNCSWSSSDSVFPLNLGNSSLSLFQKSSSPLTTDSDHILPISSQKTSSSSSSSSSSSQWSSSFAVSLVRPLTRDVSQGSSKTAEGESGLDLNSPFRPDRGSPSRLADFPLQAQVARSELNVRLPRGFERRPLKHPSCPEGTESPPKPPRTGTVPALVPKPPSYPLVKLVGKFYTLKCR